MSLNAASLYALVSVQGAGQSVNDLSRVSGAVNKAGSTMSKLGANAGQMAHGVKQVAGGLVRIGEIAAVALIGAAGASEKAFMTFQSEMELIRTQAGQSQAEVEQQTKAVMALAHSVGTAPIELAKGLYHIESVGVTGKHAMDILAAGALGAKTGLADVETTTNALTAVYYSNIAGVTSMSQAMGMLDAIVGVGNMRLQDFVDGFRSGILGTAKTFGVDIRSLGAAIATLTDAGVPAGIAMTRLSMTFTHLAAPVPGAIKVLKRLHLTQFDLAKALRGPDGVDAAFLMLGKHMQAVGEMSKTGVLSPQGAADMAKIFGGSRFGATAMQLLTNVMSGQDRIKTKYNKIAEQELQWNDRVAKTMATTKFQWGKFLGDLQTAAITFGAGIDPALSGALAHLDTFLMARMPDIAQFGKEVGAAIAHIDWKQVESGAASFVGLLKDAVGLLSKVPPQLLLIGGGFLAINKLSGGLLGTGIGNIAGGLGKGVGNILMAGISGLLSKVPGIGGALAGATAMRVFVVNMPGGGFGGGPGGLMDAAVKNGGWLALLSTAIAAAVGIAVFEALKPKVQDLTGMPPMGGAKAGAVAPLLGPFQTHEQLNAQRVGPEPMFGPLSLAGGIFDNRPRVAPYTPGSTTVGDFGRHAPEIAKALLNLLDREARIARASAAVPGGNRISHSLDQANAIARGNEPLARKLHDLTIIEADLAKHGDRTAHTYLQRLIWAVRANAPKLPPHVLHPHIGIGGSALSTRIDSAIAAALAAPVTKGTTHVATVVGHKLDDLRHNVDLSKAATTAATQAVGRSVESVHQAILSRPPVTQVDIHPQSVYLVVDGRVLVSALIQSQGFTRVGSGGTSGRLNF